MTDTNRQLARAFFVALANGELPDDMLTPDMTGWLTTQGMISKAAYQQVVRLLDKMCAQPLTYTLHSLTAEEDRVVVEAESEGELINGESYRNTYVYVMRFRDGKLASVAEHYNALIAQQKLLPLMKELMADKSAKPIG
jgi:ketosteroid isomerase-like protein